MDLTDNPELLATFRAEVDERIASMRDGLMTLEGHPSPRQAAAAAAELNGLAAELRSSIAQFTVA